MSKTDKNDDFAVFDNKDEQLQHPTGDLDLEVSSDGKDVSGDGEVIERQEPEPKPELESAHDAEVDESLENQYLEEEEKEVAEPIYTEIPDDEEPNRSSSGKSNVLLWCVTGISLLFAAGGVYTGLNAQTQAKGYASEVALIQEQLDGIKSRAVNESQIVEENKAAIEKLSSDQLTMFQMNGSNENKVTALNEKVETLTTAVNQKSLSTDNALIRLNTKVDGIEQANAKKVIEAKKQEAKKSSSYKQKPVVRKHKKIVRKPKTNSIQEVYRINGVTLASIDMWNHKYSATLMSPDGFRVIYPGYNVNGFVVKSIEAHSVTFIAPNNRLVKLRN
ncbi:MULTISPECIES: hypothetical protein [Photobacterium]|uniref:Uncharacterized protein n=1 Tax=Photobacterium carnosum TaxID=2023717 RepID=A0A2N4UQ39_9GAMM|nr:MULTISPECIES: hypothetical protein [Photobacterium]MBY3789336.1 hypothetical protein [Photobacterium carnosum]MCD9463230.1 hypothetical protein [Photobacterium phosphoreum]MCD9512365.1 hypothetical protein [Photobacterium phosphoreum]MCD9534395.1 hypothetical protein [Photobacterium carnosum]OBU42758.1 hypothetical protein AYY26_19660 [Photobacterium phosphoreum]